MKKYYFIFGLLLWLIFLFPQRFFASSFNGFEIIAKVVEVKLLDKSFEINEHYAENGTKSPIFIKIIILNPIQETSKPEEKEIIVYVPNEQIERIKKGVLLELEVYIGSSPLGSSESWRFKKFVDN